jgi:hypothetical protein
MAPVVRPYAIGFLALGFACACGWRTAIAEDFADPRARANRLCESYGRGFMAGDAPGHCVKVQERLRVEPNRPQALVSQEAAPVFSPAQDAPLRNRLRLNGGFGTASVR